MNTPKKTTEEWREKFEAEVIKRVRATYPEDIWLPVPEELRAKDAVMAQAMRDMAYAIAGIVGEISEDFIALEGKRVAEEIMGVAGKSEKHTIGLEKHNDLSLKFEYFKQMGWNQALVSLQEKIKAKYLTPTL